MLRERSGDGAWISGAVAEPERGLCPRLTVADRPLGPEVGAARDQLGELADGVDVTRRGDPDEAVCVEVVAQEQRRVVIRWGEEPRSAVVSEVALVHGLEPECVRLAAELREDRLVLALSFRPERVAP